MFLPMLAEKQKYLFLEFAYAMAAADGNIAPEEERIMEAYMAEMELFIKERPARRALDDILADIQSTCDAKTRRIFIFEIIGLVMSDGVYDASEKELMKKALKQFSLDAQLEKQCQDLIQEYIKLQQNITALIIGKE